MDLATIIAGLSSEALIALSEIVRDELAKRTTEAQAVKAAADASDAAIDAAQAALDAAKGQ